MSYLVANHEDRLSRVEAHIMQSSSASDKLMKMYRDLPKEVFLSQILNGYHSDETELYNLCNKLFYHMTSLLFIG